MTLFVQSVVYGTKSTIAWAIKNNSTATRSFRFSVEGMFPGTNPSTHFIATFQTHLAEGYYTLGDGHSFSQHY